MDRIRILILADRDGVTAELATALRLEGFDIEMADSADAARAALATARVDLALIDLDLRALRGARGLALAREIRTAYGATRVILTSSSFLTERQLERTDCGAVAFLPKPFDLVRAPSFVRAALACCSEHVRRLWHAQDAAAVPSSYAM